MIGVARRERQRVHGARRRIDAATLLVTFALIAIGAGGCSWFTRDNPMYCEKPGDCGKNPGTGWTCNVATHTCQQSGAGTDGGSGGAAATGGRTGTGGGVSSGGGTGAGTGGSGTGGGGGAIAVDGGPDTNGDAGGPDVAAGCTPACVGGIPICANRSCRACAQDGECLAANPLTPLCGTATPTTGKCVACKADTDCAAAASGPACFEGACVPCTDGKKHCTTATAPICTAGHACAACAMSAQCSTRDAMKPVCSASACVECGSSGDCVTAGKPICAANVCIACATDEQCRMKAPTTTPACVTAAGTGIGTCVECTKHADCTTATKPICVANACVPCSTDAQCAEKSPNPGVCMLHADRRCATDAEVLYVKADGSCIDSGTGLAAAPFCNPQPAISAVTPTRNVIVIRGTTLAVLPWTYGGTGTLSVIGVNTPKIGGGGGIGITITSGDVYVRGLTVTGMTGAGISASGATTTVRLNRMTVIGNAGGLVVDGAGFEISNSVFSDNNAAMSPVAFGGVYLNATSGKPSVFRYNTVTGNMARGLVCGGAYPIVGVQIANNSISQVDLCTFSGSDSVVGGTVATNLNFDGAKPYRLTASSPCRNAGGTTNYPPDDIDGNPRPFGTAADCGAHELQQ